MRRFDESMENDFERMMKLGEENAKCITGMRQWCKHFEIEQTSAGLYAQMSGLPIAGHKIGCPQAYGSESMNLPWICSDFLVNHCDGCEHHSPNGDTSWAQEIIDKRHEAAEKREQEVKQRQEQIDRLRRELREQAQTIGEQAEPESQRIVQFLESMFSDEEGKLEESATYLEQSARLAAELFPKAAIDLILALAVTEEYATAVLPTCCELAERRDDLHSQLQDVSLECVRRGLCVEMAAAVLARLGDTIEYPLDDPIVERLLLSQSHARPIGGWPGGDPDYTNTTSVLVRCFDADCESVQGVARRYLSHENEHVRVRLSGAIGLIQRNRPQIVLNLLEDLMTSLELHENERHGATPSGKLVHLFQAAFRHSPEQVDAFLEDAMNRVRAAVQEDIIRVYRDQFFDRSLDWRERKDRRHTDDVSGAEQVAIRRLLHWLKDDNLEIDVRAAATESLEMACNYATGAMLSEFDSLLGYFAIVAEQENPPDGPPKIIIPDQPVDPRLEQLDKLNRTQKWGIFKQRLEKCLEELCEARPHEVFDSIYGCLNHPNASLGDGFKGALVSLLGELGKEYEVRPRVLPLMMRALMDYGAAWVRAKAIHAAIEMFSYSRTAPPANLVDTIVVHLRDTMAVVHKAAVHAVRRRASWFNDQQTVEALQSLAVHLHVYRDDPFQLKNICDAILNVGRGEERLKLFSLRLVESVYPTGEEHVDSDIAEELTRFCQPTERLAVLGAPKIACFLGQHDRDRYNSYSYDRKRMFEWLHELPKETFQRVAGDLLDSAKQLAERDAWESCHFASLFSWFGAFQQEREVLETVIQSLPQEARHDNFRGELNQLASNAAANVDLLGDDTSIGESEAGAGEAGPE